MAAGIMSVDTVLKPVKPAITPIIDAETGGILRAPIKAPAFNALELYLIGHLGGGAIVFTLLIPDSEAVNDGY
jgi:hypothetical protein